ncbi:phosphoglycerate kinase [Patescibacteria group bacterium]|nr:MAG: phosphoglycerate kinase [Patescibacteria group bacterium]
MKYKTVKDLDLKGKRVLVRVDYNVPIDDGEVGDTLRIEASFETLNYLLGQGCSLVLISSAGRPGGKVVPELSLAPIAKKAAELLGKPIAFIPESVGPQAVAAAKALRPGDIMMLENLRFHEEEEANSPAFARQLADLGEVYVDDAFANIHRKHASMVGIPEFLPGGIGFLVEKEIQHIGGALDKPVRPLVAIIGGAKVSTKIEVLDNLMKYVNKLVIGGAMANTFLAAQGHEVGKSKQDKDDYEIALRVIGDAQEVGVEMVLPEDVLVSKSVEKGPAKLVDIKEVGKDDYIVDLGPKTVAKMVNPLDFKGSVIWNGPLGITEVPEFAKYTHLLAENIIESGAPCIVGGGDTAAFVDEAGLHDKFTWVSTGGGASLELMSGRELPGLEVLEA